MFSFGNVEILCYMLLIGEINMNAKEIHKEKKKGKYNSDFILIKKISDCRTFDIHFILRISKNL